MDTPARSIFEQGLTGRPLGRLATRERLHAAAAWLPKNSGGDGVGEQALRGLGYQPWAFESEGRQDPVQRV